MINPLGFAMEEAVVSWIADSDMSKKQTRAQIKVALDQKMSNIIYTSDDKQNPDAAATRIPIELKPRTAYYWTVEVWGDSGDSAISEVNYFETGKRNEEFLGAWIGTPWNDQSISPYIRKRFDVTKKVKNARLYMTGLGLFELEVNGKKASEEFFAPGCTSVDRLIQVYTYDLNNLLVQGDNVVGVIMGNGWSKGKFGASSKFHLETYINEYLLKAELRIELEDGTEEIITTDQTWKCAASPIIADSIYDGEIFDQQKCIYGWSTPAYCDTQWDHMRVLKEIKVNVPEHPYLGRTVDRLSLPILRKEIIKPVSILHTPHVHAIVIVRKFLDLFR